MAIYMKKIRNTTDQSGQVAFITVIVISAVVIAIGTAINLVGIGEAQMGSKHEQSTESLLVAESCLDEAFLRLQWDDSYGGTGDITIDVGDDSCTLSISGSGNTRTVQAEAQVEETIKRIDTSITLSPFSVDSWLEVADF